MNNRFMLRTHPVAEEDDRGLTRGGTNPRAFFARPDNGSV